MGGGGMELCVELQQSTSADLRKTIRHSQRAEEQRLRATRHIISFIFLRRLRRPKYKDPHPGLSTTSYPLLSQDYKITRFPQVDFEHVYDSVFVFRRVIVKGAYPPPAVKAHTHFAPS